MARVLCLIIGYAFGLFQTGYLYGRLQGVDLRQEGSGNSGTTNALRVMGPRAGAIVFAGDLLKCWLALLVTMFLFNGGVLHDEYGEILAMYTALGVVLGHNFPFYLNFRGGKGIAVTAALIAALDWRLALFLLAVFVLVVFLFNTVSLGSISVMVLFFFGWWIMGANFLLPVEDASLVETCVLVFILAALAIWQHRKNIRRLIQGTESPLFK